MALLLFAARFVREETTSHLFQPRDGEVVAIKSTLNGKYFEVSPNDGKLYATASRAVNKTALFRVMVLSRPMVDMLADAMRTANAAEWAQRKTTTQSGCRCSGYSNDHGFGSYCYGWEFEAQVPWCYVTEECKSEQVVGSFGRKFEDCPLYDEPGYDDPGYDGNFTDWSEPYYNESEWAASWEREREYEQEYARQFDEGEEGDEGEPWWQEAAEWDPDEESTDFGSKLQRDLWKSNWRADSCECNAYCVARGCSGLRCSPRCA